MAGWQGGEGAFGLVGTPLENGWEATTETSVRRLRFRGNPKWGHFPSLVRGLGAEAPRERGGPRSSHGVCGIAWPRGKAQPQGAFPWGVPPSNPKDSNPLSCSLLLGLRPIDPDSPCTTPPVFLLHLAGNLASWGFPGSQVQRLQGLAFGSHYLCLHLDPGISCPSPHPSNPYLQPQHPPPVCLPCYPSIPLPLPSRPTTSVFYVLFNLYSYSTIYASHALFYLVFHAPIASPTIALRIIS